MCQSKRGVTGRCAHNPPYAGASAPAERKDVAVGTNRRLRVADAERQAEIWRGLKFDAGMRAIELRARAGIERSKRTADAASGFQRVEAGIDRKRQAGLELVAELHAVGLNRVAERIGLVDAGEA